MRRRFGRRRRGEDGPRGLDVARELTRVVEEGVVPATALHPVAADEVPPTLAAVGTGEGADGAPYVVSVSPESGAAAWLGGLSVALRLAREEGFQGRVFALSPRWRAPARALLGAIASAPFELRALTVAAEGGDGAWVEVESGAAIALSTDLAGRLEDGTPSGLHGRAVEALGGLAAKHGGVLHRDAAGLRLILMGQPVAALRSAGGGAELELLRPRRERIPLAADALSDAFDQLEGSLRKVLADRKNRDGEPGLRAREARAFAETLGLRSSALWPVGWGEHCPIDALGSDAEGRPTAAAIRRELDLPTLLPIVEGAALLEPVVAWLLSGAPAAGSLSVRLAVAAERFEASAERVLQALSPAGQLFDLSVRGRNAASYTLREGAPPLASPARSSAPSPPTPAPKPQEARSADEGAPAPKAASRPDGSAAAAAAATPTPRGEDEAAAEAKPARRFEEMSLFDLSDDEELPSEGGGRRRRRRGGRGRSRGGSSSGSESAGDAAADPADSSPEAREEPERPRRSRRRRRRRRSRPLMGEDVAEEEVEDEEEQGAVAADLDPGAADEDDVDAVDAEEEEEESEEDVEALEEEAASAALEPPAEAPAPSRSARPVRRRAAIVAHADPTSIGAGVLLARDLRLVDGIWVYRQDELMTFFRSVATDLSDNTSIYLIGFTASPVRETLQTASLYGDRITWFDHHDWPPEDADALARTIGADAAKLAPGCGSSLPLVADVCTRRSRFSDKLLDLLTGRFSPHDYERWGRLWWWRLVELTGKPGERRRELEPLLTGRPSDLAREAAKQPAPPLPAEAEFVASHDLPLVHFGGYTLLRLVVPVELDLLLSARIARERYGAHLAVAVHEGDRVVVLVGDDAGTRRGFDLSAMAEHLAAKFSWVEVLPGADHVTRFRVVDLLERPERIEEVVAEVAMGRSVLEG